VGGLVRKQHLVGNLKIGEERKELAIKRKRVSSDDDDDDDDVYGKRSCWQLLLNFSKSASV
jgi:hypothetical protein